MRRDHFELDVAGIEWTETDSAPEQPFVSIEFTGSRERLTQRLATDEGQLASAETDIAFRLQEPHEDDPDAQGVVGITNRITGEFVLELNETAADVLGFVQAAREYGEAADDEACYVVELTTGEQTLAHFEKDTFLVYDADGNLLRTESLIPSGVEL